MALKLFLDKMCLPSTITLAGAAEEVLGRLAAQASEKPVLEEFYDPASAVHRALNREELDKKVSISGKN